MDQTRVQNKIDAILILINLFKFSMKKVKKKQEKKNYQNEIKYLRNRRNRVLFKSKNLK